MRRLRTDLRELRTSLIAAVTACSPSPDPEPPPQATVRIEPSDPTGEPVTPPGPPPAPPSPKLAGYQVAEGRVDRLGAAECSAEIQGDACRGTEGSRRCETDADCQDGAYGRCIRGVGQIGDYCACRYSCRTDADCGKGEVCVCAGDVATPGGRSVCAEASCRSGSDCDSGVCGVSSYHNGCSRIVRLACRTDEDACSSDADCSGGQACVYTRDGWACRGRSCVIGRPLRIAGEVRSATPAARRDWQRTVLADADLAGLSPTERAAALAHYEQVAAMEHASVASFARFTLQLMALGAPAELLADTQRAAADEVRHAELMYGIAAELAGTPLGPGPLDAAEATPVDPTTVVEAVVEEGCVGETLGAMEAMAAADAARPAELRAVLRAVAEDEARHAELAWRTLAWVLERHPEERPAAERALARAMDTPAQGDDVGAETLGVLGAKTRERVHEATLGEVVVPTASELGLRESMA